MFLIHLFVHPPFDLLKLCLKISYVPVIGPKKLLFSDPGFKGKLGFQTLNLSLYLPIQPSAHVSILPLAHSSLYNYLSTIPPFRGWEPKRGGAVIKTTIKG